MTKFVEYYASKLDESSLGIENKLKQTVAVMNEAGYSAKLIFTTSGIVNKYISLSKLLVCSKADVVIIRNLPGLILCSPVLILLRYRGVKVIVDVPTPICTAIQELNNKVYFSRNTIYRVLFRITFPFALWPASVVLQYSNESRWFKIGLKRKIKLIANGIEVKKIPIKKSNSYSHCSDFIMIAVASLADWHGFDRLISGMAEYYKNHSIEPRVKLLVVGDGEIRKKLEELTNDLSLNSCVHFYGFQSGEMLNELFDSAHVAISSLGLHRINLELASVLKAREYCARGIPFIATGIDIDFSPVPSFVKIVPNDNSLINISEILDWYVNSAYIIPPKKIREYALNNLDFAAKIKAILC